LLESRFFDFLNFEFFIGMPLLEKARSTKKLTEGKTSTKK